MKVLAAVLLGATALVGAAPLAGLWTRSEAPSTRAPEAVQETLPHVETARPTVKTIHRRLKLPGEVLPFEQAALFARVQGYLESIPVDRGASVKAGDVLAKIAVPEIEKQLAREKAELGLCAPSIARDEAELRWRETIFRRLKDVAQKSPNLVNQDSLDDAEGRCETARAGLELTRAREAVLRAEMERTQTQIGFATIRAPFDGVVTERWMDPGDLVQPGSTKLLQVMKIDPVRVRVHIPQSDVQAVRPDSRARVSIDELPGKTAEVPVARLFWALNRNTKTMAVEMDVANPDRAIRPGMFAHVAIELEARENAVVLPAAALVAEKKEFSVFVVREGVARKVAIQVGFDDGIEFEVRQGIGPEDEVIVNGKNLVADGEKVRTSKAK
jgi:RND family efflux transporter MFP subunit